MTMTASQLSQCIQELLETTASLEVGMTDSSFAINAPVAYPVMSPCSASLGTVRLRQAAAFVREFGMLSRERIQFRMQNVSNGGVEIFVDSRDVVAARMALARVA
jgi:hypothetical protein